MHPDPPNLGTGQPGSPRNWEPNFNILLTLYFTGLLSHWDSPNQTSPLKIQIGLVESRFSLQITRRTLQPSVSSNLLRATHRDCAHHARRPIPNRRKLSVFSSKFRPNPDYFLLVLFIPAYTWGFLFFLPEEHSMIIMLAHIPKSRPYNKPKERYLMLPLSFLFQSHLNL